MLKRSVLLSLAALLHSVLPQCTAQTSAWSELQAASPPSPRSGMSGAMVQGRLIVFGGCSSSCCYAPLSDTWVFDPSHPASWARITTGEREIPPARVYHTAVAGAHTDYLVFGGSSVSAGFLSDLWQLNVTGPATGLWQRVLPKPGERPPPRAGHTAALWEGRMVVFGGRNSESVLNDVWVYDVEASEWSQAHAGGAACSAAGSCPSPRTNHAAVLLEGDLLLVNGGSSADGTDLNDSWLLHLPSSTWTPAPSIASPAPRHGHAMWSTASLEGAVLYGGQAGTLPSSPFWGDTWAWCASKAGSLRGGMGALGSWVKVQNASYAPHGGAPQPRAYVAAAGAAGLDLLFGGFSGYQGGLNDELHQDTWALNASSILKRACL